MLPRLKTTGPKAGQAIFNRFFGSKMRCYQPEFSGQIAGPYFALNSETHAPGIFFPVSRGHEQKYVCGIDRGQGQGE